jgi:type III pantothenate kinase
MFLCLDIGNSQIYAGLFDENTNKLCLEFRYDSLSATSVDQLGIFFRQVIRENGFNHKEINRIGVCSVVPSLDYPVKESCIKYLGHDPFFIKTGVKTGIQVRTHNPNEVGSDLIAQAMAVKSLFPTQNSLIFSLGTAITCSHLSEKGEYLGVAITAGIRLMSDALQKNTAKLFNVEVTRPEQSIGKNTKSSIQSGIYYTALGFMEKIIEQYILESGDYKKPLIIGTGGFCSLFASQRIFDHIIPELPLIGIYEMLTINQ